jgi:hypothetical protein
VELNAVLDGHSIMIIVAITVVGTVNTTFNAITTTALASPVATGIATRPWPNSFEKTQGRNAPHRLPLGRRHELRPCGVRQGPLCISGHRVTARVVAKPSGRSLGR